MAPAAPVRHLTTAELAERWHTTPDNIRVMRCRSAHPAHFRRGKECLYRLADVEAFEESLLVRST